MIVILKVFFFWFIENQAEHHILSPFEKNY